MNPLVGMMFCLSLASIEASDTERVIQEVSNLRQKYEECKASQHSASTIDIKRYNQAVSQIAEQKAIIADLEKKIQSKDRVYRAFNERMNIELHRAKVGRIERQQLLSSLVKAKTEIERLNAMIKNGSKRVVEEKIVEKVVYKEPPVNQEKVVVKSVKTSKPTEAALPSKGRENVAVSSGTTASYAYRISGNAPIYNAPGGSQIDTWEDRRSFTAGHPNNGWIRISGYFVDRVWQPTAENEVLWVRERDTIRR